jgi:hypothetical protein
MVFLYIILKEPDSGIIQLVYEKLSIRRQKNKKPVFAFWDNIYIMYITLHTHMFSTQTFKYLEVRLLALLTEKSMLKVFTVIHSFNLHTHFIVI